MPSAGRCSRRWAKGSDVVQLIEDTVPVRVETLRDGTVRRTATFYAPHQTAEYQFAAWSDPSDDEPTVSIVWLVREDPKLSPESRRPCRGVGMAWVDDGRGMPVCPVCRQAPQDIYAPLPSSRRGGLWRGWVPAHECIG